MYYGPAPIKRKSLPKALYIVLVVVGVAQTALAFLYAATKLQQGPSLFSFSAGGYTHFVSDMKFFSCDRPAGWSVTSSSSDSQKDTPAFLPMPPSPVDIKMDVAQFEQGDVKIMVFADNMPAAFDQLEKSSQTGAGANANASSNKPFFDLKDMSALDRIGAQASVQGYKEGQEKEFRCPLGAGSDIDFTGYKAGSQGMSGSGSLHGLSATIMGQDQSHVMVLCVCSQAEWPKARPVFAHVVDSVAPGK